MRFLQPFVGLGLISTRICIRLLNLSLSETSSIGQYLWVKILFIYFGILSKVSQFEKSADVLQSTETLKF